MLNTDELWQRIRALQGQIVYTLDQEKPNKILRVTNEIVEIERRATKPTRSDIYQVYKELHKRGEITGQHLYGNHSVLGHPYAKKAGRIIIAILARVAPDEIDVVKRSRTQRLSGIRLKR